MASESRTPCPGKDHGTLRFVDQLQCSLVLILVGRKVRTIAAHARRSPFPIELASGLLRVLGNVNKDRSGTPRLGDIKGFPNGVGNFACVRHKVIVLGNGKRNSGDVGFLKGVRAEHFAPHLARNAQRSARSPSWPWRCRSPCWWRPGLRLLRPHPLRQSRARSHPPCAWHPARGAPGCDGSNCASARRTPAGWPRQDNQRRALRLRVPGIPTIYLPQSSFSSEYPSEPFLTVQKCKTHLASVSGRWVWGAFAFSSCSAYPCPPGRDGRTTSTPTTMSRCKNLR